MASPVAFRGVRIVAHDERPSGIMSSIYTKAEEWGDWPEGRRNPISRVKIGQKWSVRPERILTEEETVRVLARLSDPNLLVVETAIATGARICEILGLTWHHVDLENGVIHIAQRNWCGDAGFCCMCCRAALCASATLASFLRRGAERP